MRSKESVFMEVHREYERRKLGFVLFYLQELLGVQLNWKLIVPIESQWFIVNRWLHLTRRMGVFKIYSSHTDWTFRLLKSFWK